MVDVIKTAVADVPEEKAGAEVEKPEAEVTEVADVKDELAEAKEEAKDPDLTEKQRDKVQARIDGLIAQVATLKQQLEEKSRVEVKPETPKVTEAALIAMLNDASQAEYHEWARLELSKMYTKKEVEALKSELQRGSTVQNQLDATAEEYPDMLNSKSELYQLANDLYINEEMSKTKNGVRNAVEIAARRLGIKAESDAEKALLQKKVDKAVAKTSLASGGKKVVISETANFDKIKKIALEKGPNSQEWRDWQKATVKKTRKDIV